MGLPAAHVGLTAPRAPPRAAAGRPGGLHQRWEELAHGCGGQAQRGGGRGPAVCHAGPHAEVRWAARWAGAACRCRGRRRGPQAAGPEQLVLGASPARRCRRCCRRVRLPGAGRDVILSDTVGFISDLPHQLVEAFKVGPKSFWTGFRVRVCDVGFFKHSPDSRPGISGTAGFTP